MMTRPCLSRGTATSVALAATVGSALAAISIALSIEPAGGGHGTMVPFHVYFGPVWLVWMLIPAQPPLTSFEIGLALAGMVALYGLYGAVTAAARRARRGLHALCACLLVHYAAVGLLAAFFEPTDRPGHFAATLSQMSPVYAVVIVPYFFGLHALAVQYARSDLPYRPRLTRMTAGVLLVGLALGVVVYAWGRWLGGLASPSP